MTAPGNREALSLSLSCLCCAMAGTFCSVVVCLVGGFMVRRVQDWQKSHQGLRAHLLPACMHGRTHAHAPVWAFVQQEDKYGWHLHACVMRRRSTVERQRDREKVGEYVYVYALFVYGSGSFIRTYACAIGSTQSAQAKKKEHAPGSTCILSRRKSRR
jgi:hypothetical protein